MSTSQPPLPAGQIELHDNFEPGLHDGSYTLELKQAVSAKGASVAPASHVFHVRGPRFAIDPADVQSTFPDNGATGTFDLALPNIVLSKKLLAWERAVPGLPDKTPWLALLVFEEGELAGAATAGNMAETTSVSALLAKDLKGQLRKPVIDPATVSADEAAMSCQAITFSSALFAQIMPSAREATLLAHSRRVHVSDKPDADTLDPGWYSVVVANRLPAPGTAAAAARTIVHLVSLEGFGDLISGDAPQAPAEPQVTMVSLASWTFSCLADPAQSFAGLARGLSHDPGGTPLPAGALALRLPFTPSGKTDAASVAAERRLSDGYVALGYHTRSGDDGFAWYRGPCTPNVPNPVPGAGQFATADAAAIYDPATGVFDLSLATAWQAGRSLALANQTFATALFRVRKTADKTLETAAAPSQKQVLTRVAALFGAEAATTIGTATRAGVALRGDASKPSPRCRRLQQHAPVQPLAALRTLAAQPSTVAAMQSAVAGNADATAVADFLAGLRLVRDVPFLHLVPDARMLPEESIRFFYLDPGWLAALEAGALSIGLGTSRDRTVHDAIQSQLEDMAADAALAWRARRTHAPVPAAAKGPTCGFLLRSALVSGWPGLAIAGTNGGKEVPILRLDRPGQGLMICLFNGVPDTVTLTEPMEGLEFGLDDDGKFDLRDVSAPPHVKQIGHVQVIDPAAPGKGSAALRGGGKRVLNLAAAAPSASAPPNPPADLLGFLAAGLKVAPAAIGPADLALQMVKGPEQLIFSIAPQNAGQQTKLRNRAVAARQTR